MDTALKTRFLFQNYIEKLLPVFESCEDLESIEDLHKLYTIMKSISGCSLFKTRISYMLIAVVNSSA